MAVSNIENRQGQPVRSFHYLDSVYFQDGHWITGVLAGVLYLILAAALDAAGHVSSLSVVVPVTAGAYVLGVLMAFSRFDGFFALSHSMFVGLAWILFLMAGIVNINSLQPFLDNGIGELQARVYFVLLRLLDWVDAALTGKASADNFVFIFEICFLLWWLTYLGAWSIFRHGYTWRAIIPAGVVLLINTYYAPNSTVGFLAAWVLIALILLIRTNLAEQQLRWREQRIYFNPDIVWDFLRNSILFSVVLVMAAWILPGLGRNPQVREVLAPLTARWEETSAEMQRLYQGLNRRPVDEAASFTDNLTLGGERNVSDTPVFQVQTLKARYWRAVTFDTYDGRGWQNTAQDELSFAAGEIVPVAAWRAREAISQTVTLLAPIGDVLFGAPEIAQADLRLDALTRPQAGAAPIAVAALDATGGAAVEFTMVRALRDLDRGESYRFTSAVTKATVQDLEAAGADYPAEILDRFVQIPPEFSPRVAALAQQLTAGATTPYAQAKAVESYLRTIPYNDAIPAPPAGADPLEYFLFDIREGYCDYYASAMAMMLRSVGVPARAVSGYAEGLYDEEIGGYFVTQRDAHTWVEVFFPEYGWIEFEPTAGESPLDRPQAEQPEGSTLTSQQEEEEAQPESPLAPPTPPADLPHDEPPPFSGDELLDNPLGGQEGGGPPWWVWAMALAVALGAGALLVWRIRTQGLDSFALDAPVLFFERMQRWTQRLGLGPSPTQTPYEHARQVAAALPETQPYVQEITETYVQFRFRPPRTEPGAAAVDPALNQTWRKLEPFFWRAWWQRLRQRIFGRKARAANHYDLIDSNGKGRDGDGVMG